MASPLKVALIQMRVEPDPSANLVSALAKLDRFVISGAREARVGPVLHRFWGERLQDLSPKRANEVQDDSDRSQHSFTWYSQDVEVQDGRTPLELFLQRHGASLGAGERTYVERLRRTALRLYEVVDVELDAGLEVVDLWTNERFHVGEKRAEGTAAQGDLVNGRGYNVPSILGMQVGAPYYHAGNARTLEELFGDHFVEHATVLADDGFLQGPNAEADRRALAQFVLSIDEGTPVVALPASPGAGGGVFCAVP